MNSHVVRLGSLSLALTVALAVALLPAVARGDDAGDGMELLSNVPITGATDLEVTPDHHAVVAVNGNSQNAGLWVIDVGDPTKPKQLGHLPCAGSGYDLELAGDIAIMSIDSASGNSSTSETGCNLDGTEGAEGIRLVDISDRRNPREVAFVATPCGSHTNIPVEHAKKTYVYVQSYTASTSGTCASLHGIISVVDITNPAKPEIVAQPSVLPAVGCHDGTIHGDYAYMACLTEGQIWDISDPLAPQIIANLHDVPDLLWHTAAVSNDGKTAAFGFESFGPGQTSCNGVAQGKSGAIYFYDVSDPAAPRQLSSYTPQRLTTGFFCTSHNFSVVPDIERDVLVAGWYVAGVMAIDFSDPAAPEEIGHFVADGTSAWHAVWHEGHMYVGDGGRGMDVFSVDGLSPAGA